NGINRSEANHRADGSEIIVACDLVPALAGVRILLIGPHVERVAQPGGREPALASQVWNWIAVLKIDGLVGADPQRHCLRDWKCIAEAHAASPPVRIGR